MVSTIDTRPALAAIDEKRVLDLEQRSIRIPSLAFQESEIADLYADYGPGDIRIYREWPTPGERARLADLVAAAKAVAHATVRLWGCILCRDSYPISI